MTKQEEITKQQELRGAFADVILKRHKMTRDEALWEALAYTRFLHSHGAVIQIDDRLPSIFDSEEDVMSASEYKKLLTGYVKVESIKEVVNDK